MEQALVTLKQLKAKLVSIERSKTEPIAIVGMGCRFPGGGKSPEAFWNTLKTGVDAIREVPANRWNVDDWPDQPGLRYAGFLDEVDGFDASFFGIAPREAVSMDPQQRLLLEVTWEALENAGLFPERLMGSRTGVFVGISSMDYLQRARSIALNEIDAYVTTGNAMSVAAGRLSYVLGLQGPCLSIDTACSSSLVTVHLACQSLRNGEIDLALAGGVNLLLSPVSMYILAQTQALAPDGRCKTFDARANGFVRAEGCGMLVLKRLSDAQRDGDHIWALVRGSAVNQDGHSTGLTAPNELSQENLLRQALDNARISPAQVSYIEAHGTGTSLGDPIEVEALKAVLGQPRPDGSICALGSVKTNLGHMESASGVAGIIKVVLSLQHETIPRHLHFRSLNPMISLQGTRLVIASEEMPWRSSNTPRIAGVSSFGLSGTNAHVLLEEAPQTFSASSEVERPLHILTLSARSSEALRDQVAQFAQYLSTHPQQSLGDICHSSNAGRTHFAHRLAVTAASTEGLRQDLCAWLGGLAPSNCTEASVEAGIRRPKVGFLFTGQGSQYAGMGRQLYETQPVFRDTLNQCAELVGPLLNRPLLSVLYPEPGQPSSIDETAYTQPALFALEYALFQLWRSWGLEPDAVLGHSVGEYVAACVAGVFGLKDGLKLIAERGRLMQALPQDGAMVAVRTDEARVLAAIKPHASSVSIAAINGPDRIVIAGERWAVKAVTAALAAQGIETKQLLVSHAFHSPLMDPILSAFEGVAENVEMSAPRIALISNVSGSQLGGEIATPSYWRRQVREPVRFAEGMAAMVAKGCGIFVEIGPHPILLGMGADCVPEGTGLWLPSLRKGKEDWRVLLESLGHLYMRDFGVDWKGFDASYRRCRVPLPTYPFQRQRYWIETPVVGYPIAEAVAHNNQKNDLDLLRQGDSAALMQQLQSGGYFSEEELKIVDKGLNLIAARYRMDIVSSTVQDWLYEIKWQVMPRGERHEHEAPSSRHWLIFADQGGVGQALVKRLEERGEACQMVQVASAQSVDHSRSILIDSAVGAQVERVLQEWLASGRPLLRIVHLWSLDAPSAAELPIDSLGRVQEMGCGSVLPLVQAIIRTGTVDAAQLWLVTRGAVPAGGNSAPVSMVQSPLWGMGRAIAVEHPEIWGGLLDLDTTDEAVDKDEAVNKDASQLVTELLDSGGEDQIAFRKDRRYVARLVHRRRSEGRQISLRPDGSYLITGGLGGVGLCVARWMVERGAKYLLLLSRRGAVDDAAAEVITELKQAGAEIRVCKADVSNPGEVAQLLDKVDTTMPALRGIVHAAGVLEDGVLLGQNWESFERVMAPKVQGAWNLHVLTQVRPVELFVCFSSAASLLGSPGQGNYAAANAFLDALMHYRHALGLSGVSINWGPWAKTGMVASLKTQFQRRLTEQGLQSLSTEQALYALERILGEGVAQAGVLPIQWAKWIKASSRVPPLLQDLLQQAHDVKESRAELPGFLSKFMTALETERRSLLENYVRSEVAHVLGMDPLSLESHRGFAEMGMDSLMAVELRNRLKASLGKPLSATLTFNYPNLVALDNYLYGLLSSSPAASATLDPVKPPSETGAAFMDSGSEPIAIIGMSCRFPGGAKDLESFWQLLETGVDAIVEVPPDRWDIDAYYDSDPDAQGKISTRYGGFLESIDRFDPQFFGISPREATRIDPQQRLLLEVSWEALEHAGVVPSRLVESRTGIFVGISNSDYGQIQQSDAAGLANLDVYDGTGNGLCFAAGRLSYVLGVQGPSMSIDTACSSSLVAVHLACQSLRTGECEVALAGGVNVMLSAATNVFLSRAHALSPDGRCKTFDAAADGYGRAEGCGMLVLKRLSKAIADGDLILAMIRGSAVNHDGPSSGLTIPNGRAQQDLIRQALASAGIAPTDVSYIEAHGTGTTLGDPIEMEALGSVLGAHRTKEELLWVGAVKTNIGHLEAAAGIAGLVKVVLALQHEALPPNLHFTRPNPHILWDEIPVRILTERVPWLSKQRRRIAGVSSFGLSGTNGHVILEGAPQTTIASTNVERPLHLLTLSARSTEALRDQVVQFVQHLSTHSQQNLGDICHTANAGRTQFTHRLVVATASVEALRQDLGAWLAGTEPSNCIENNIETGAHRPKVAFLFTGQGSQYAGMGRQLYETQPVFRDTLNQCAEYLGPVLDRPLLSVLYPEPGQSSPIDETVYTQPALFALEYALFQLWRSWGLEPDVVLGHSVGEYVAACVAGVFGLEEGLKLIAERGRLMQALPRNGAMVAVRANAARVLAAIEPHASSVSIASFNGPNRIVIAGEHQAIGAVVAVLTAQGVETKQLVVSHAFHSQLMDPMLSTFERIAEKVAMSAPRIALMSNVSGSQAGGELTTPSYWRRQVREPVRFAQGMATMVAQGCEIFVEIGPHPTLLGMGADCVPEGKGTWLPSLRKGKEDWRVLLESLGRLHVRGVGVDWKGFDAPYQRRRVPLPTYPFQRQRYWVERTAQRLATDLEAGVSTDHPLLGQRVLSPVEEIQFVSFLSTTQQPYLADHRIYGNVIIPGALYIAMALTAGEELFEQAYAVLEDIVISQPLVLAGPTKLHLVLKSETEDQMTFQLSSPAAMGTRQVTWCRHATGTLRAGRDSSALVPSMSIEMIRHNCRIELSPSEFYDTSWKHGVQYGSNFRLISKLWHGERQALALLEPPSSAQVHIDSIHPALLDACFQVLGAALPRVDESPAYVPFHIASIRLYTHPEGAVWCHATCRDGSANGEFWTGDLQLFDSMERIIATIEGLQLKRVEQENLSSIRNQPHLDWLYELTWRHRDFESAKTDLTGNGEGRWLIFTGPDELGERIVARLKEEMRPFIEVTPGDTFTCIGADQYRVNPANSNDYDHLFDAIRSLNEPLRGVIYLWGLGAPSDTDTDSMEFAERLTSVGVLHLVQAISRAMPSESPRLLLVSRGAQAVSSEPESVAILQAPLWGLGRVIAQEHPELHCVLIDLDGKKAESEAEQLSAELGATDGENQVAYREGKRYVARLTRSNTPERTEVHLSIPEGDSYQLVIQQKGVLDNLALKSATRRAPEAGEVEIEVQAAGLNFRDVLNALGMYPGEAGSLGSECAGIVVTVGEGVSHLSIGDEVIAMAPASFSRYVMTDARCATRKPRGLSPEQAATIPIAFLTAWYGLYHLGRMSSEDRVLVHAAAGGVGMAAVQLAQRTGAEVFGTASPGKWEVLRARGVRHIMNSRTLEFAEQVKTATQGRGVSIVLNALAGEFIPKSISVMSSGGRFLEMGKTDIWNDARVAAIHPDVSFHAFDLGDVDPNIIQQMFSQIVAAFELGELQPLPHRAFGMTDAVGAFRYMAQAKHVGKLVLMPEKDPLPSRRSLLRAEGTYMITGGLGALGLVVAQWMVDRGARHLVLVGRQGATTPAQVHAVSDLEARGAEVRVIRADVSDRKQIAELLRDISAQLPPLRGLIHAAGVLDDGVLLQQEWERFRRVLIPKVAGALHLHELTRDLSLDFFVLFSSAASLLGSPGQANYATANAFLDALSHFRRAQGLPAVSINWGAWSGGGMADRLKSRDQRRFTEHGIGAITPEQGIELLELIITRENTQIGVIPFNWPVLRGAKIALPALLVDVAPSVQFSKQNEMPARSSDLLQRLSAVEESRHRELLQSILQAQAAKVLGLGSATDVQTHRPLKELGLDSLMAVELRNAIAQSIGSPLSATLVFDYPTIESMSEYLLGRVLRLEKTAQRPNESLDKPTITNEPIAIVGIGCRFPGGGNDPEAFWSLLAEGVDVITQVPAERWDIDRYYDPDPETPGKMYTRWGGFLKKIDQFDAEFFGISPREAMVMDPQQRLLLEVSWEALEHAGQKAEMLTGSSTGVFVGISSSEYGQRTLSSHLDPTQIDAYAGTGNTSSVAAGRISYVLGLQGPCIALDTACSSSLVAVHLACQGLRAGECEMALAGGVNMILIPETTIYFSRLRAMSPDGHCKAFDASANGYVRGEGCGIVVLKRLSTALRDDDRILAVIRGSAVNQDGRSNGLTAPNGPAQETVIRRALRQAGVKPAQVGYVEAHGTGTPLGDPIEIQALAAVLGEGRAPDLPVMVGSVKTNIGHTEGAAGVAGLIKAVLALQHRIIPPSLHFSEPNPHVVWNEIPVRIATESIPWPESVGPRVAGVSSFGFSGTNAHVILEEAAPHIELKSSESTPSALPVLLPLSAKSPDALRSLAQHFKTYLIQGDGESSASLDDMAYTAGVRRSHHEHRLALVGSSRSELVEALDAFVGNINHPAIVQGYRRSDKQPKVVFVYPGHGSQWPGMARQLIEQEPVFREALTRCDAPLRLHSGWSPLEVLCSEEPAVLLGRVDIIQPTLFAIEVALSALWRSWGVEPDAVVGHSMGEIAAAHVAGVLSLDDAARIICRRSQLLRQVSGKGAMMVVESNLEQMAERLIGYEDRISIAASNSPSSTVLSGDPEAIEEIANLLKIDRVFCRRVKSDVAFHSPQMEPLRQDLVAEIAGIEPKKGEVPIYSTVWGDVCEGVRFDPRYWGMNLREPVQFVRAVEKLIQTGHTVFVELSPHPILMTAIEQILSQCVDAQGGVVVPSLRRERVDRAVMLDSLGVLYSRGYPVDFSKLLSPGGRCVPLPTYPWQRKRYWVERLPEGVRSNTAPEGHPILGEQLPTLAYQPDMRSWEVALNPVRRSRVLQRIQGVPVLSLMGFAEMVDAVAKEVFGQHCNRINLSLVEPIIVHAEKTDSAQLTVVPEDGGRASVQLFHQPERGAQWRPIGRGVIEVHAPDVSRQEVGWSLDDVRARCVEDVPKEVWQRQPTERELVPLRLNIEKIWQGEGEVLALVSSVADWASEAHHDLLQIATSLLGLIQQEDTDRSKQWTPVAVDCLHIDSRSEGKMWIHMTGGRGEQGTAKVDVSVLSVDGACVADIRSLEFRTLDLKDVLLDGTLHGVLASHVGIDNFDLRKQLSETSPSEMRRLLTELISAHFARVLGFGQDQVLPERGFLDLGMDSITAVQLMTVLGKTLGQSLPTVLAFEHPSARSLAEHLADRVLHLEGEDEERGGEAGDDISSTIVPRDEDSPLSSGQLRLWLIDQLAPSKSLYNVLFGVRMMGPLNIDILEQSLGAIVQRHETLRTVFPDVNGQPCQRIVPSVSMELRRIDLRDLAEPESECELRRIAIDIGKDSFDLVTGPLVRTCLVTLRDQDYALLVTQHHIVTDGWSIAIFFKDLASFYQEFSTKTIASLQPLSIQYKDYAHWQQARRPHREVQRGFWKERLDALPPLRLPTDHPRPLEPTNRGATLSFAISKELTASLKDFARREGCTIFMVLFAAYVVLLYRYSEQNDIGVGTVVANRDQGATQDLIGFFVNMLVLRVDLSGAPAFADLLSRVRTVVLEAFAHADVPFEEIIEATAADRRGDNTPLVQANFVLENVRYSDMEVSGMRWRPFAYGLGGAVDGTAKFDLTLFLAEVDEQLRGEFEYSTDLFDAATVERMVGHYQKLLEGIDAAPEQCISALPLLTEPERHRTLVEWNDTAVQSPDNICLHELFEAQAARTPEAIAVVFKDERLTYRQINQLANRLGHQLRRRGARPNMLVSVVLEKGWGQVAAVLGIQKSGAAYVPIDPGVPADRFGFLLQHAQVRLALTDSQLDNSLTWPEGVERICLDRLMVQPSDDDPIERAQSPDDLAYVIYTSGSTGLPKGVMIDHRGPVNTIIDINERFRVSKDDRVLAISALNFDLSVYDVFGTLAAGGTIVLPEAAGARDPAYWAELCEREHVTVWNSVPALVEMLVSYAEGFASARLSSLRLVLMSGDWLPVTLPDRLKRLVPGISVTSLGGATEASIWSILYPIEGVDLSWRSIPYGRPMKNQRFYVLNDALEPCPIGVEGALFIGGVGLAKGYWDDEALTRAAFIEHPQMNERLYRTGDQGKYLPDGTIEFLGRKDFQVKIRGFRIELGEIEVTLVGHEAVRESVVLVREDVAGDKRLVAYVVLNEGAVVGTEELRGYLKGKLPDYMIPSAFVELDAWPLTANGKIDRRALPAADGSRDKENRQFVAPRSDTERMLAEIWSQVLGVAEISIHDNFFTLGGHSLLSTQVVTRIRSAFAVDLSIRQIFAAPILEDLATVIVRAQAEDVAAIELDEMRAALNDLSEEEVLAMLASGDAPSN